MSFFIPSAHAQGTGAGFGGDSSMGSLIMIAAIFALMYFMLIRPQRKRQKEHQEIIANISKGDEVITTGGILGKVIKVDENYMVLEVSGSVEIKFQKQSVHAVLPKGTIKGI